MGRAVVVLLLMLARSAQAGDCATDAASIRAHLVDEAQRAHRWNLGWGLGLGAIAAGELVLGLDPTGSFDRDFKQSAYVGAAEATIGVLGFAILPLKINVPAASSDACADLSALRAAAARTAKLEREQFWMQHVGGLIVNTAGMAYLAYETDKTNALV